ncbi:hypothetical protein V6N13_071547 [Hibiscus sabdariffa]
MSLYNLILTYTLLLLHYVPPWTEPIPIFQALSLVMANKSAHLFFSLGHLQGFNKRWAGHSLGAAIAS